MSKHTPGPWSVRYTSMQDGKGGHCSVSIYKGAKNIFAKRVQGRLALEDEANAALIAAAPDMLDALEHLDRIFTAENARKMGLELEHDEICRVIAGAKGEA